jgi:hypothetical protein
VDHTNDSAAGYIRKKWKNIKGLDLDRCHLFNVIDYLYPLLIKNEKKICKNNELREDLMRKGKKILE